MKAVTIIVNGNEINFVPQNQSFIPLDNWIVCDFPVVEALTFIHRQLLSETKFEVIVREIA